MNNSAQGSITVKRLRTGDTFFISFTVSKPLFQAVDQQTGNVSPDWTNADNQPVITPVVTSARSNSVTLNGHRWKYNGAELNFSGATSGDWTTDTTGKFQLNSTSGALKIIKNLASKDNMASDTLTYSCIPSVAGVEYTEGLTKDIDIQIQSAGSNSYTGYVLASNPILREDTDTCTISTTLYLGGDAVEDYSVKWYKDNEEMTGETNKSLTVRRSDVDGMQLFIARFFVGGIAEAVDSDAVRITDAADEYTVQHRITSAAKEVDKGKDVTVEAYVVKIGSGGSSELTALAGRWRMDVMEKDAWSVLKTSSTGTGATEATHSITVTTSETDAADGTQRDVEVVSEVTFDL